LLTFACGIASATGKDQQADAPKSGLPLPDRSCIPEVQQPTSDTKAITPPGCAQQAATEQVPVPARWAHVAATHQLKILLVSGRGMCPPADLDGKAASAASSGHSSLQVRYGVQDKQQVPLCYLQMQTLVTDLLCQCIWVM